MPRTLSQCADERHPVHVGHLEIEHDRVERSVSAVHEPDRLKSILGLMELVVPGGKG